MEIIILLLCVAGVVFGSYYVVRFCVKLWTGCSDSEASGLIHDFVKNHIGTNTGLYSLEYDSDYIYKINESVKNIIGEIHFNQLISLNNTAMSHFTLLFGENSGLPYVAISVFYNNDNEKQSLETVLCNLTRNYLLMHDCSKFMLVDWKYNYELQIPCIEIRYARTQKEEELIKSSLSITRQKIIASNSPVIDTEDDEDLT